MFIQTEQTPNPQTLKFLPGKPVMNEGTAFFQNSDEASPSPLAKRLFLVEGVVGVFLGSDFITITKNQSIDWQVMKPLGLGSIMDHYSAGDQTLIIDTKKNKIIILCGGPNRIGQGIEFDYFCCQASYAFKEAGF